MVQMPLDAPISLLCDAYEAQRGYPKDIPLRWRWSGMIMDRRRSCREMNIQKEATIRLSLPLLGD